MAVKHGARTGGKFPPEYNAWKDMRQRCWNVNHPKFKHYGARGITICVRWNSFAAFRQDMGPKPKPHHTYSLDRIKNDGNYTPSNCKWSTRSEQNKNRRINLASITRAKDPITGRFLPS
jgi:hypothetical protein